MKVAPKSKCTELCDLDVYSGYNVYHHTDGAVVVIHGNNNANHNNNLGNPGNHGNNHGNHGNPSNHHGNNPGENPYCHHRNNHVNFGTTTNPGNPPQASLPTSTIQPAYPKPTSPSTKLAENLRLQPDGSRSPVRNEEYPSKPRSEIINRTDVLTRKRKPDKFSCSGTFTELCSKFRNAYRGVSDGASKSNESGESSSYRYAGQNSSAYCQCRWNYANYSNTRNTQSDDRSYRVASARHYVIPEKNMILEQGRLKSMSSPGCYSSWSDRTKPPYLTKRTSPEDKRGQSCFLGLDRCGENTKRTAICHPVPHEPCVIRDLYYSTRSDFRTLKRGRGRRQDCSDVRRHHSSGHSSVIPSPPEPLRNHTTRSVPSLRNFKSNNTVTFSDNLGHPNCQQKVNLKGHINCASNEFLENTGKKKCVSCEALSKQKVNGCSTGNSPNQIGEVDARLRDKSRSTGDIAKKLRDPDSSGSNAFNKPEPGFSNLNGNHEDDPEKFRATKQKSITKTRAGSCKDEINQGEKPGMKPESVEKKSEDLKKKDFENHPRTRKDKDRANVCNQKENAENEHSKPAKLNKTPSSSNSKNEAISKDQKRRPRETVISQDPKKFDRDKTKRRKKEVSTSESHGIDPNSASSSTSSGIIIGGSLSSSLSELPSNFEKDLDSEPQKGKSKSPKKAWSRTENAPEQAKENSAKVRPKDIVRSPTSTDNNKLKRSKETAKKPWRDRQRSEEIQTSKKSPKKKSIRSKSNSSSSSTDIDNDSSNRDKPRSPVLKKPLPAQKKIDREERKTNVKKHDHKRTSSKKVSSNKPPSNPRKKQGKQGRSHGLSRKERKDSPNDTYYEISEIFDTPDSNSGSTSSVFIDDEKEAIRYKIGVQPSDTNQVLSKSTYSTSDSSRGMKEPVPSIKEVRRSANTNVPLVPPPRSKKRSKITVTNSGKMSSSDDREQMSSLDSKEKPKTGKEKESARSKGSQGRVKKSSTSVETRERPFNITTTINVVTNDNGRNCKSCEPIGKKLDGEYCLCQNEAQDLKDKSTKRSRDNQIRKGKSSPTSRKKEDELEKVLISPKVSNEQDSEPKQKPKSKGPRSNYKNSEKNPNENSNARQPLTGLEKLPSTANKDTPPNQGSGELSFVSITGSETDLEMKSAVMTPDLSLSDMMMSCCDDLDGEYGVVSTPLPTDNIYDNIDVNNDANDKGNKNAKSNVNNNDKNNKNPVDDDDSLKRAIFGNKNSDAKEKDRLIPQITVDQIPKMNRAAYPALKNEEPKTFPRKADG